MENELGTRSVQETVDHYIDMAWDMVRWRESVGDQVWDAGPDFQISRGLPLPYLRGNDHAVFLDIDRSPGRVHYELFVIDERHSEIVGYSYTPSLEELALDMMEFSIDFELFNSDVER